MAQENGSFPKSLIWVEDSHGDYEGEGNMFGGKYAVTNYRWYFYGVLEMQLRNTNLRMVSRDNS